MSRVLFYSTLCPHSKKYYSLLEKTGEIIQFHSICIDKINGVRPPVVAKYNITMVPTIIADEQKLEGVEAFKWLAYRLQKKADQGQLPGQQNVSGGPPGRQIPGQTGGQQRQASSGLQGMDPSGGGDFSESLPDINFDSSITGSTSTEFAIAALEQEGAGMFQDSLKKKQADNDFSRLQKEREALDQALKNTKRIY